MTSLAVRSRATGWAAEGARQLRVALTSELGVMVAAFSVLRMIAVVHQPASFPDTNDYHHLSFIGGAQRLWTVPLVWKLLPSNDLREAGQLIFGITAWSTLAVMVARVAETIWLRRIGTAAVLALGLVPQITAWDSAMLSESISNSLLVLLIALLLRAHQRPSRALTITCLAVSTLWTFARHVHVLLLVAVLPFVAVFLLRRGFRKQQVWVVVTLAVVAGWGLFALEQPGIKAVWKFDALQILENRIAPDPSSLAFLYAHGLPHSPVIPQERGAFRNSASALFRDPAIQHWLDHDFKSSYLAYLSTHPDYSVLKPFVKLRAAVSSDVDSGPARAILPTPVAQLLWSTRGVVIMFWVVVAAAVAVVAFALGVTPRFGPVTGLLVLGSATGAVLLWDTTGDVGGGDAARKYLVVAVTLRLAVLLTIITCGDALLRRRRGHAGSAA